MAQPSPTPAGCGGHSRAGEADEEPQEGFDPSNLGLHEILAINLRNLILGG